MPCEIISSTKEGLDRAAEALRRGDLVAMPTETVYGLGGNAWHPEAADRIYVVKGRPPTDPLICHVDVVEKGQGLWAGGDIQSGTPASQTVALALFLGKAFWPGPLTIVCRAHPTLPERVTGGSGYVGLRIPAHPVALALLQRVSFPVAAPSANTFGHVSPTSAQHVHDDLASRDPNLLILDGGKCGVGIESTVIKIVEGGSDHPAGIEVLRRGKITVTALRDALSADQTYKHIPITIRDTRSQRKGPEATDQKRNGSESTPHNAQTQAESTPMDGPGQLLTHYSPKVPASLLTPDSFKEYHPSVGLLNSCVHRLTESFPLATTIVIDFHGLLRRALLVKGETEAEIQEKDMATNLGCLAYLDLSPLGNPGEASARVFDGLRWSEQVVGGSNVVFPFLTAWSAEEIQGCKSEEKKKEEGDDQEEVAEILAAVEDRLFRAASGVIGQITHGPNSKTNTTFSCHPRSVVALKSETLKRQEQFLTHSKKADTEGDRKSRFNSNTISLGTGAVRMFTIFIIWRFWTAPTSRRELTKPPSGTKTMLTAASSERDGFILYQEQLLRQNEGDEVDTSADQKIQIDLHRINDSESAAVLTFSHEDHTLGNPLRHVLMQNPEVSSAGYSIPHPLESKMLLHVHSTDYAVEAVAAGLERLAVICEETLDSFNNAMKMKSGLLVTHEPLRLMPKPFVAPDKGYFETHYATTTFLFVRVPLTGEAPMLLHLMASCLSTAEWWCSPRARDGIKFSRSEPGGKTSYYLFLLGLFSHLHWGDHESLAQRLLTAVSRRRGDDVLMAWLVPPAHPQTRREGAGGRDVWRAERVVTKRIWTHFAAGFLAKCQTWDQQIPVRRASPHSLHATPPVEAGKQRMGTSSPCGNSTAVDGNALQSGAATKQSERTTRFTWGTVPVVVRCQETFTACLAESACLFLERPFCVMNPNDPPKRQEDVLLRLMAAIEEESGSLSARHPPGAPSADSDLREHTLLTPLSREGSQTRCSALSFSCARAVTDGRKGGSDNADAWEGQLLVLDDNAILALLAAAEAEGKSRVGQDPPAQPPSTLAHTNLAEEESITLLLNRLMAPKPFALNPAAAGEKSTRGADPPDRVAYVIFTSGSTGPAPKGVLTSRRNLLAYYDGFCCSERGLGLPSRQERSQGGAPGTPFRGSCRPTFLTLSTPYFDPSIGDMLCAFLSSDAVQLCIPQGTLMHPDQLNSLIGQLLVRSAGLSGNKQVAEGAMDLLALPPLTHIISTPAVWDILTAETAKQVQQALLLQQQDGSPASAPLVKVFLGGERMRAALLQRWAPLVRLYSIYGVTEATIYQSASPQPLAAEQSEGKGGVGCGYGVGTHLRLQHIEGEEGGREGDGLGEVLLCGPQVSLGYLPTYLTTPLTLEEESSRQIGHSAEPYIDGPPFFLCPGCGERGFCTGDLGRFDRRPTPTTLECPCCCTAPEGGAGLQVLGRRDFQVKIRGQRVSLEEVESGIGIVCRSVFSLCCCCALEVDPMKEGTARPTALPPPPPQVILGMFCVLRRRESHQTGEPGKGASDTQGGSELDNRLMPIWEGLAATVLPPHMIPRCWMVVEEGAHDNGVQAATCPYCAVPFTATGKVDRAALSLRVKHFYHRRLQQAQARSGGAKSAVMDSAGRPSSLYLTVQQTWQKVFGIAGPSSEPPTGVSSITVFPPVKEKEMPDGGDERAPAAEGHLPRLGGQEEAIDRYGHLPAPFRPQVLLRHPVLGDYVQVLEQMLRDERASEGGGRSAARPPLLGPIRKEAFLAALELGHEPLVALLLDEGLYPANGCGTRDPRRHAASSTPLHTTVSLFSRAVATLRHQRQKAAMCPRLEPCDAPAAFISLMALLVAHGAKVTATTPDGVTPAHLAAAAGAEEEGQPGVVAGTEVVGGGDGSNSVAALDWLLSHGTPLGVRDGRGQTLMHFAARAGHAAGVRYLLHLPSSPPAEQACGGAAGVTPSLDVEAGFQRLRDRDKWQRTPVHWAALHRHTPVLEAMLEFLEHRQRQREDGKRMGTAPTGAPSKEPCGRPRRKRAKSEKEHFVAQARKKTHLAYETLTEIATRVTAGMGRADEELQDPPEGCGRGGEEVMGRTATPEERAQKPQRSLQWLCERLSEWIEKELRSSNLYPHLHNHFLFCVYYFIPHTTSSEAHGQNNPIRLSQVPWRLRVLVALGCGYLPMCAYILRSPFFFLLFSCHLQFSRLPKKET
eukprot:gene4715-3407_t